MLLTELVCQVWGRVTLVHYDALLLVGPKIDINEEQRRIRIIEVIVIVLSLLPVDLLSLF